MHSDSNCVQLVELKLLGKQKFTFFLSQQCSKLEFFQFLDSIIVALFFESLFIVSQNLTL